MCIHNEILREDHCYKRRTLKAVCSYSNKIAVSSAVYQLMKLFVETVNALGSPFSIAGVNPVTQAVKGFSPDMCTWPLESSSLAVFRYDEIS